MSEGSSVEHNARILGARGLHNANQGGQIITLFAVDFVPKSLGSRRCALHMIGQGGGAVDARLAGAQQMEIRPMQQQQATFVRGHAIQGTESASNAVCSTASSTPLTVSMPLGPSKTNVSPATAFLSCCINATNRVRCMPGGTATDNP